MKHSIKSLEKKIFSIKKIAKLTKAMKVIATVHFQKAYQKVTNNAQSIFLIQEIYGQLQCLINYEQIKKISFVANDLTKKAAGTLWIVFTSDLGLCGNYNTNLFHKLSINPNLDALIIIGKKGSEYYQKTNFRIIKHYPSNSFVTEHLQQLVSWLQVHCVAFAKVMVLFTQFFSHFSQKVIWTEILPVQINPSLKEQEVVSNFIAEPSAINIYQTTLSIYLTSLLQFWYWNSRTSEEKIRQVAMENASKNAHDMVHDLKLEYNQLRQELITKEVILVSQDV